MARLPRSRSGQVLQKSIGSITFSITERLGSSWKNWKTIPRLRPRQRAIWFSLNCVHGGVAHQHLARCGAVDAGDHVDQRGLAAARFADDADELAAVDLQVDAVERRVAPGGVLVDLGHLVQLDQGFVAVAVLPFLRLPGAVISIAHSCVCSSYSPDIPAPHRGFMGI